MSEEKWEELPLDTEVRVHEDENERVTAIMRTLPDAPLLKRYRFTLTVEAKEEAAHHE